jgi:hypothetical protein
MEFVNGCRQALIFELRKRIDQIVAQAEQQGTLVVAVSGLNPRKAY